MLMFDFVNGVCKTKNKKRNKKYDKTRDLQGSLVFNEV